MKKLFFIITILISLMLSINSKAYDTNVVHPIINITSATKSSVNDYIRTQLMLTGGLNEELTKGTNTKMVKDWFKYGGELEDASPCRSKFHFHDPIKSFEEAGFSNFLIDIVCLDLRHISSVVWAQDDQNEWSWQKARQYFYDGLTATDNVTKEENYADMFRSLGQVMHLVADGSVPYISYR